MQQHSNDASADRVLTLSRHPGEGDPTASAATDAPQAVRATSTRLPGIDGLRAVAALWVVLFHIHSFSGVKLAHVPGVDLLLRSGSTGVSLFLVISGFCLYLPFAGERLGRFKTWSFLVRRGRRLLPAYYVSLLLALLALVLGVLWLGDSAPTPGALTWQLFAHLTLIHTFFPSTFYTLNGAYWSLGLEWQLYLGLPLLIAGIKRVGLLSVAVAAIACNVIYRLILWELIRHGTVAATSLLATAVLPNQLPGRWAEFVFGMVAAELYVGGVIRTWAYRLAPALLLLVPLGFAAVNSPLSHLVFGSIFAIVLGLVLATDNVVHRAMSWPPLVAIGIMSYSLYLVHQPIVGLLGPLLRRHLSPTQDFVVLLLLLPFILALAWLLFITVERRTISSHPRQLDAERGSRLIPFLEPARRRWWSRS